MITSLTTGPSGTATGFSDGVGFSLSPTSIYAPLTVADGTFTGFGNSTYHNPPIARTSELHIGDSFTFTFDQVLSSALVYFTDNPDVPDSEIDFGVVPTIVSGDVAVDGTKFRPTTINGGIVRLSNLSSNVLHHTRTTATGGLNFAIYVTPVPEPAALATLGLSTLAMLRRRARRR